MVACRSRRRAAGTPRACPVRCSLSTFIRIIVSGALVLGAPLSVSAAGGATRGMLAGCWEQISHAPLMQPSSGEEWGSRSWCFAREGQLVSRTIACGTGGCDGWDNQRSYRWRPPFLALSDVDTSADGKTQTRVWRRCRVQFLTRDWMQLQNCEQSPDPWIREKRQRRARRAQPQE
ncbi:hypothetical protein [Bradyrhizobium oligotrophicum]